MSKMKRLNSKKSYSWWWDSHISPKNSKWLEDHLEEMDQLVKKMLRLIDEEGDSFAKKAEMYYQRRPELISNVEGFYRMYRALAERYDNVTGELRRSMPPKNGSPGSGGGSLPPISSPDHTPKRVHSKSKPSPRAAGFDVFLGSGGSSDISRKGSGSSSSSSSSSDSESDIDSTKEGSFRLDIDEQQRISELETELEELRQRLSEYEGSSNGSLGNVNQEDLHSRLLELEREHTDTAERIKVSEEEIKRLQQELETKIQAQNESNGVIQGLSLRVSELELELASANARLQMSEEEVRKLRGDLEMKGLTDDAEREQISELERKITILETEILHHQHEIQELKATQAAELEANIQAQNDSSNVIQELSLRISELEAELSSANARVQMSEEEVAKLRYDLEMKGLTDDAEREQISELERKIAVLETEVARHQHESEEMKAVHATSIEQLKNDISERDVAAEGLKIEYNTISEKYLQEKCHLDGEIAERNHTIEQLNDDLRKFSQEKSALESKLSEMEHEVDELKQAITLSNEKFLQEKQQLEAHIHSLSDSHSSLTLRLEVLEGVKLQLENEKEEAHATRVQQVSDLNRNMDELKTRLDMLTAEKDERDAKISVLLLEMKNRDDRISNMDSHLHQLHMEHVKLIKEAQEANKVSEDLRGRVKVLEEEVEAQRIAISDSAEEKREAIRQLCFSLEHYRVGYQELRQALVGHRRTQAQTVLAS